MSAHNSNLIEEFRNYTFDSCHKLFEQEYNTIARIVDIYDGDTCTIVMKFNNIYNKFIVRLNGIDTCEIKAKSVDNKKKAYLARDRLLSLITNTVVPPDGLSSCSHPDIANNLPPLPKERKNIRDLLNKDVYLVNICITGTDKYGRLLGDLYSLDDIFKTISFSSVLLTEKLAYKYEGGTKKLEEEQLET